MHRLRARCGSFRYPLTLPGIAPAVVKLEFIDPMADVTFLCPNKKVTKEVVRGEALRANRMNFCALATGKRIILIRCAEHHLAPDPTPAAATTAH